MPSVATADLLKAIHVDTNKTSQHAQLTRNFNFKSGPTTEEFNFAMTTKNVNGNALPQT